MREGCQRTSGCRTRASRPTVGATNALVQARHDRQNERTGKKRRRDPRTPKVEAIDDWAERLADEEDERVLCPAVGVACAGASSVTLTAQSRAAGGLHWLPG